ncbi:MAG: guanylate kinase [Muribaculaceae bacterium]|nr:guanylate kinase [Muribaculaceae bacterium]
MKSKTGKIIVICAPSGCGKSTILNTLLDSGICNLKFSVSATNRKPRPDEEDGVHYHFMSTDQFRDAVAEGKFVEWEQVYPGRYYGTLKSELQGAIDSGENVVLDIDVKGAMHVKELFGDKVLTIFILPPDIETLRKRLIGRGTDAMDEIERRVNRARYEISFADKCDGRVINDDLETAISDTRRLIRDFIG